LSRLFRVIIYKTSYTKMGRDWPVKQPNRKSDFFTLELMDNFRLESVVEPRCAEHGAVSEGGIERVEGDD
jgi:hypothetical protein